MDIAQFEEQTRLRVESTLWGKRAREGKYLSDGAKRRLVFLNTLRNAIISRVKRDTRKSVEDLGLTNAEANKRAAEDLIAFSAWDGWDKVFTPSLENILSASIDESVVKLYGR